MNDYAPESAADPKAPDPPTATSGPPTALTPAELLRFAAAGRREYAKTAPPEDRAVLLAEADGYDEAAKLIEDPARIGAIIPTAMPAPAGKRDPRNPWSNPCRDCGLPPHRATRANCPNNAGRAFCLAAGVM